MKRIKMNCLLVVIYSALFSALSFAGPTDTTSERATELRNEKHAIDSDTQRLKEIVRLRRLISQADMDVIFKCMAPNGVIDKDSRDRLLDFAMRYSYLRNEWTPIVEGPTDVNEFKTMLALNGNVRIALSTAARQSLFCYGLD